MNKAMVITPVKNSIERTLETIAAVKASSVSVRHVIFDDFSDTTTQEVLQDQKNTFGYELIHLEDVTSHPSPNYKLVLQMAQKEAILNGLPLIVVESDVEVQPKTIEKLLEFQMQHANVGLVGTITVDEGGTINYPYLKFKQIDPKVGFLQTERSLSFCCTLFTLDFLNTYSFEHLDDTKDWYDTFLSAESVRQGFKNFVLFDGAVWHKPHGSRPWKQLKYTNPIQYYLQKFFKGRDKI
jgi:GT2 family glycosyltransferase